MTSSEPRWLEKHRRATERRRSQTAPRREGEDESLIRKALAQIPREILREPFPQNPGIDEMKAIRSWWQVEAEAALERLITERDRAVEELAKRPKVYFPVTEVPDILAERDRAVKEATQATQRMHALTEEAARLRAALERIADPEVLDANWREMRRVARAALSGEKE